MQDDEDEKELRDMFRILDKEKKGEVNTNELRYYHVTSCARGDTMCLRPLQVDNVFVFIRQVAPGSGMLAIWDISNKLTFDLLTLNVVAESRVTWATSVSIFIFQAFLFSS